MLRSSVPGMVLNQFTSCTMAPQLAIRYRLSIIRDSLFAKYTVKATSYNLNGTVSWSNSKSNVNIAADTIINIFTPTAGTTTPWFLDLNLYDSTGMRVSHNFYWQPMDGTNIYSMFYHGDYKTDTNSWWLAHDNR